ncbi:FUSC family protein [Arsenicicoccus dermatophilus]|uniref:FUSC family protein n=1 Tax=Arsenicicoccus dermatophilus TaxID=1076331 RepID=UPI001F4D2F5F|nr:FUSC family protein [Arsenicicoccus dermatophilus]MCH8613115.1 FUSC family protein [Arsenicicoccus dermatophilus]
MQRDLRPDWGDRAVRVGRSSARVTRHGLLRSGRRLRQRLFFIAQCSVGAATAYSLAHYVFHIRSPLFAPVAAIVALGMTYGQRLRRAVEITIGVAVGAFVGESFVHLFGIGPLQVFLIVAVGMMTATLLGAGQLMANQAGIQGMIVALLAAAPGGAFGRWFEALLGSVVALVFASFVPSSSLIRPRSQASKILDALGDLLHETSTALRDDDLEACEDALGAARSTEKDLTALRGFSADSLEVMRVTPFHRQHRPAVAEVANLMEPMDRAIRNARVLIRRATVALQNGEHVPDPYVDAIDRLADAVDHMADALSAGRLSDTLEPELLEIGRLTRTPDPDATLSAEVIRAQLRSIVVDLLQVLGLSFDDAQHHIRQVLVTDLGDDAAPPLPQ